MWLINTSRRNFGMTWHMPKKKATRFSGVTRAERVRGRVAQTPVIRYQNPETGRTVTIVATIHAGTSAYFKKLGVIITRLEAKGAVICYEGITSAAEKEWATAGEAERAVRGVLGTMSDRALDAACQFLGWVRQSTGLCYSPSWRNIDMTDIEVVRGAQPRNLDEYRKAFDDGFGGLTLEQFQAVAGSGLALGIRLSALGLSRPLEFLGGVLIHSYRQVSRVTIEERNRVALARLPPDADAVLVWGGGHLAGLAAGLKRAGYRRRSVAWVSVGKLPPLWASLKAFSTLMRTPDEDGSDAAGAAGQSGGSP